jgi:hypothetical protein
MRNNSWNDDGFGCLKRKFDEVNDNIFITACNSFK